jgi:hypothetical protein
MARINQEKGTKGSLKWIQEIVNTKPQVLDKSINKFIGADKKQNETGVNP